MPGKEQSAFMSLKKCLVLTSVLMIVGLNLAEYLDYLSKQSGSKICGFVACIVLALTVADMIVLYLLARLWIKQDDF